MKKHSNILLRRLLEGFLLVALTGCGSRQANPAAESLASDSSRISYATGFRVASGPGYTQVEVADPWNPERILQRYLLVPDSAEMPEGLPEGTVLRTPLRRVVAYSSVHCGVMDALGARQQLAGLCESRYVDLDFVRQGIAAGRIVDVGDAMAPNIEQIVELAPDAILATPIDQSGYGRIEKLGIPIVELTDYMEALPLGRSEWIKLYGLLFGCEERADSLFRQTEAAYLAVKALAAQATERPKMLAETKSGGAWYLPGGRSYMANLYRDAGADYPWSDNTSAGSVPLSFEHVLERGADATVWVMKYNRPTDMTYTDLKNDFAGYASFDAFKNRAIFACNTGHAPYYEELPIHPDRILKNIVWVFHPELLPDYEPRYFHRMSE